MDCLTVNVPVELKPFVDAHVASGQYASADDFVRALIEDAISDEDFERVENLIHEGLQTPVEEVTPQTWASLRAELRQRLSGHGKST